MKETQNSLTQKQLEELYSYVPLFLSYTNKDNINWIKDSEFASSQKFMNVLKEALKEVDLYENEICYYEIISLINKKDFFDKPTIDTLINKSLKTTDIKSILRYLCNIDTELANYFINNLKNISPDVCKAIINVLDFFEKSDLIYDNIDLFIEKSDDLLGLYKITLENSESNIKVKNYINENLEAIISNNNYILYYCYELYYICDEEKRKYLVECVRDNIKNIIKNCYDLFEYKKNIENIPEIKNIYEEYINDNFRDILIKQILNFTYFYIDNTVVDLLYLVFDEICKNENKRFSDIDKIGAGAFSKVYGIGEKVIKIGYTRTTYDYPNNPYILTPLLRKRILLDKSKNKFLYVEVQEKVQKIENDYKEEELYKLYKNIRDLHLIWVDVKPENVGRLIKDNKIYWNEEITPTAESLGFTKNIEGKVLRSGELVILDSDFIFDENIFYTKNIRLSHLAEKFEERYQNEKNLGKAM